MTTKTISYWDSLPGAMPSEAFHTNIRYCLRDGSLFMGMTWLDKK